jgi:hypothetical protein
MAGIKRQNNLLIKIEVFLMISNFSEQEVYF